MKLAARPPLFGRDVTAVHAVGVGGMGLGPLAIYLAGRGFIVSGEDDNLTEAMRVHLVRAGVTITAVGAVPTPCDLVVYSSAIAKTHPAYVAAVARQIPLARRGEVLAEVTRDRKLIGVCGSHGKTTTTAMIITALRASGFPAGYVLGGLFGDDTIAPAAAGKNGWVVAEIDESDGTIARFSPEVTVAVNLDWDHPDHYPRLADLEDAFAGLFARTRAVVLVNDACALSARVVARHTGRASILRFGHGGDYRGRIASEGNGELSLALEGRFPAATAQVRAFGEFNATNATAALAAAHVVGVADLRGQALAAYPGVRRRQAVLSVADGVTVIEDYAHHPAEIRALVSGLRRQTRGKLVLVFQPHRFSRTKQFKDEFAAALTGGDVVGLIDVYGAGEAPMTGGTTADVAARFRAITPATPLFYHECDHRRMLAEITALITAGDLVAFVGAGDIDLMAREWLAARSWDVRAAALRSAISVATTLKREEPLARKTTMGVGGAARLYAEPANLGDLQALLRGSRESGVPVVVLGRGSNLIVPDEGVDALVLSLRQPAWETFEPRADGRVWVGAGLRLKNLCGLAVKAGLVGFEFLEGIPGNVGGALRMNAGAMGGWMFDVVEEVQVVDYAGEVRVLRRAEMHVDYRHCAELHDAIALGALLKPASQSEAAEIARQIEVYKEKRQKSQPREPSAGCIFKNPPGDSAGRLIDVSGLKGERVGDAEVSPVHANFIVNRGEATAADIISLVKRVRARVAAAHGVTLEPEVLLYGKEWKDVL